MDDHDHWTTTTETLPLQDGRSLAEVFKATIGRKRRVSLLIYHRDGAELVPLHAGRPLVVGRAGEADITIRDGSLSRRHAQFEVIGDEVWVQDLGSTNGTRVNGEAVERCQVAPIDQVVLGSLPVAINMLDPLEEGLYGLDSHDRLRASLGEEIFRARMFGRQVGLLMVSGPEAGGMSRWCPDVRRLLRPFDRAALYGPRTVEILYPEATREQLQELARHLSKIGEACRLRLACGVAFYPGCSTTAEGLVEVAREANQRACSADEPLQWAEVRTTRELAAAAGPDEEQVQETGAAQEDLQGADDDPGAPVLRSPAMQRIYDMVRRLGPRNVSVLIQGETGTGKEVVARAIHEASGRKRRPLCCVNCGALPPNLVESTLFGHEKGAFTGAHAQAKGVFETASGGTVLLDEIGELPPEAQASLLRVLETRRITRVGSAREIAVDTRIMAATHRDLAAMSAEGAFREDLLYRLNVMTISVPPLRERTEEILPLAYRFIQQANEANGCAVGAIDRGVADLLRRYPWPGNVRELRNVIERAAVIAQGDTITTDDLPDNMRAGGPPPPLPAVETSGTQEQPALGDEDLRSMVQRYEAELITQAMEQVGWERRDAAELLGVPLRTLAYKMRTYGIRVKKG
jgi:DNA-binding NtrC family response regulator